MPAKPLEHGLRDDSSEDAAHSRAPRKTNVREDQYVLRNLITCSWHKHEPNAFVARKTLFSWIARQHYAASLLFSDGL